MKTSLILTLIGPDRPGLVSAVSACAGAHGANWMESRLTRLAGQFAGVVRLEVDAAAAAALERGLLGLGAEVVGHDRPGIVRDISAVLARHGLSIDALETACENASMSGEPLFRARAELAVPAGTGLAAVRNDLEALANELMVDLDFEEVSEPAG